MIRNLGQNSQPESEMRIGMISLIKGELFNFIEISVKIQYSAMREEIF